MTQQELQDLITKNLGPIIDQAQRIIELAPNQINSYLEYERQLQAGEITQEQFDVLARRELSGKDPLARLAFYVQLARRNGSLPASNGLATLATSRLDSDWAAFVGS